MTTLKQRGVLSIVFVATLILAIMSRRGDLFPSAARWLFACAALQSVAAFVGLTWALRRSNAIFYSIFVGDALLRFAALGVSLLLLNMWHIPVAAPLFCLAGAYLILSMVQIPFLHRMPLV